MKTKILSILFLIPVFLFAQSGNEEQLTFMGMPLGKSAEEFKTHLINDRKCEFVKKENNSLYFKGVFSGCDADISLFTTQSGKVYTATVSSNKSRFDSLYMAYDKLISAISKKYATFKKLEKDKKHEKSCLFLNNRKIISIHYKEDHSGQENLGLFFTDGRIKDEILDIIEGDI